MISESALYESIETNGVFIGGGQYGKIYVHTVEDGDPTGLPPGSYAFKIQRQGYYQYVKAEIQFRSEYRLLYADTLLKLVGFGLDDACRRACLVMEYISGGQLKHKLHDLELQSIVKVLHDIAYGLHLVHSHFPDPIIHGDLKPENVLLKGDKALLCDFGTVTSVGERRRRSDPVYDGQCWGFVNCTKTEVYFIGVLLFEMITNVSVKYDENDSLIERVMRLISMIPLKSVKIKFKKDYCSLDMIDSY
ncbi:probable LRR receptor-like serine/threonine-protein kinase At1g74360 [Coffea eugenioides]|uniref:probable LRR receptor-like serine/threonine-protein kinase At1g74360 n=1 Tax=Coffea eugenioides TaxID=49369 RepID=UPI000F60509A|nr:probable LRR receptor-like serine/threonine-protein kinase At1g74360 [Coffea eugenioides]